jgi:hypothetical protein
MVSQILDVFNQLQLLFEASMDAVWFPWLTLYIDE